MASGKTAQTHCTFPTRRCTLRSSLTLGSPDIQCLSNGPIATTTNITRVTRWHFYMAAKLGEHLRRDGVQRSMMWLRQIAQLSTTISDAASSAP